MNERVKLFTARPILKNFRFNVIISEKKQVLVLIEFSLSKELFH
jgi:hypothetical protein